MSGVSIGIGGHDFVFDVALDEGVYFRGALQ